MIPSEPSLLGGLNQSGGSKKATAPRSLVSDSHAHSRSLVSEGHVVSVGSEVIRLRKTPLHNKENNVPEARRECHSGPPSPVDPNHKPSYLKLSCAVSGYGKYSRYSTYKDVNKRSPYSSQSSLRSEASTPDPTMPAEKSSSAEASPEHKSSVPASKLNGHTPKYPTGDISKDGEYFLQHTHFEEDRIRGQSLRAEAYLRSHDLPEDAMGRIRSAIGKANLLLTQKFGQFRELCNSHMQPDPEERETKWEDLQGFWDMVKIQVDLIDDEFANIELQRENGWQEIDILPTSKKSSANSSPKSANVSAASTPSATPGHTPSTKRRGMKPKAVSSDPESPDRRNQKAQAAKARDEARKKMLAERRAAMKQQQQQDTPEAEAVVEIFVPESNKQDK